MWFKRNREDSQSEKPRETNIISSPNGSGGIHPAPRRRRFLCCCETRLFVEVSLPNIAAELELIEVCLL
jgi:hypothetical protein